jgi:hypothetical protein
MSANDRMADPELQRRVSRTGPRKTRAGAPATQPEPGSADRACRLFDRADSARAEGLRRRSSRHREPL